MTEIIEINSEKELEELFRLQNVLIFKNSTQCGISRRALNELREFVREAPEEFEVRMVDVIRQRNLSRVIAERTGIVHQSPQAILLKEGNPVWNASHFEITVKSLRAAVGI